MSTEQLQEHECALETLKALINEIKALLIEVLEIESDAGDDEYLETDDEEE